MAIEVFEQIGEKLGLNAAGDSTLGLRYFITGTEDREAAVAALLAQINTAEYLLGGRGIVLADSLDMDEVGPGTWSASIDYKAPESSGGGGSQSNKPTAVGEVTFAFDGTGGTFNLLEAFEQTKYGANAPDHEKRININNGKVDGVEIVVPQLSLTLTQRFAGETITLPWLRSLVLATGTVNSDPFLGFEPGEVLFLGPTGQQPLHFMSDGSVTQGDRDVSFRVAISPNRTDLTFGDITGVTKAGHDYLWVQYEEKKDSTERAMTKKPIGVYVAQVYRRFAFSGLGISNPAIHFPVAGV